jgi:hypothetical protein
MSSVPTSSHRSGYGYCPVCGAEGVSRERRPDGDDKCQNGHKYPSRTALKDPPTAQPATSQSGWHEGGWVRRSPQFPAGLLSGGFGWLAMYKPCNPSFELHPCPVSVDGAHDLLVVAADSVQGTFRWRWCPILLPFPD